MAKHETTEHLLPPSDAPAPEAGIDLLTIAIALLSEWRIAMITFVVSAFLCLLYIYSLKPQYVAHATFLPQEGRSETESLASIFSSRGPGALYIGLLQSETVQNDVIRRDDLLTLFHTGSLETARGALAGISSFADGADTIITISVREGNAQDAARIANSYLVALKSLNENMGQQQSTQTIEFFKGQLAGETQELKKAEDTLASTQKSTGVISDSQTSTTLSAIEGLRDQITGLESRRQVLLLSETEQNPEVERIAQQISVLRGKELQLEGGGSAPTGAATPASEAPQANLQILRAQREVKYHELLVNSLTTQFQAARLNEAFARSAFQVIDVAVAPEHKAWPPRKPYFLIALVFSAFFGAIAVAIKLAIGRLMGDPEHREQFRQLGRALGRR